MRLEVFFSFIKQDKIITIIILNIFEKYKCFINGS